MLCFLLRLSTSSLAVTKSGTGLWGLGCKDVCLVRETQGLVALDSGRGTWVRGCKEATLRSQGRDKQTEPFFALNV